MALRSTAVEFATAVNTTEPLFEPVFGATVNQEAPAETLTLQDVFEATARVSVPPAAKAPQPVVGEIVNVGTAGACVTVTVLVTCGLPAVVVNVTVALR